ncbi:sugar ABC transporter ATP-binding protein [Hoeflea sp. G2-23]|uniref:Sugar ABC transporter ATP-binding protein n=1 Tax=Hoeflea algicola TaxID=2983763 RepID=A0ABT3ZA32_9HYPH|nr:sugar ABC transporter ATP-binding protein [Hoeflea algicola]MCY0148531.1 sugar ABC transporter ATP-binding protein [Hoeflea algicola]
MREGEEVGVGRGAGSSFADTTEQCGRAAAVVQLKRISKNFGPVAALRNVDFCCRRGEVHALVGENGAGKSTLVKVLVGALTADSGDCAVNSRQIVFRHPADAQRAGIAIVHQELNLLPDRTVAENIFMGREKTRNGVLDHSGMRSAAQAVLKRLNLAIDPDGRLGDLSVAGQQMVEIAKAIAFDAQVLVLDEPTATLAADDSQTLFDLVRALRANGLAVVYISHRMSEIFDLCDRVTVLKDGASVLSCPTAEISPEDLVKAMIGRDLEKYYPPFGRVPDDAPVVLRVANGANSALHDINLQLRKSEIVGVFGLKGSGRSELAYALWGAPGFASGEIETDGKPSRDLHAPRSAMTAGVGFVPESRKDEGLALSLSIADNAMLPRRTLDGAMRPTTRSDSNAVLAVFEAVGLNPADGEGAVSNLSGGNQQKVVLSKWLLTGAEILVLAEPTRGVDVSAKAAIYALLRQLADSGKSIILLSSELPEIIGMSDRIYVMRGGTITKEFARNADEAAILMEAGGPVSAEA